MKFLPTMDEVKARALPYGLAFLCLGVMIYRGNQSTAYVSLFTHTKVVKQVETKEVIKYVTTNQTDNRRVEVVKPDGTRIVSTHDTVLGQTESTKENSKSTVETKEDTKRTEKKVVSASAKYNLGLFVDRKTDLGLSLGVRLGGLPIFLQGYFVPASKYGAVGIQLEI